MQNVFYERNFTIFISLLLQKLYFYYYIIHHFIANHINSNIQSLGESVADGKSAIASAITQKGVSTATDASFTTIATNIGKIKTDIKHEVYAKAVINGSTHTLYVYVDGSAVFSKSWEAKNQTITSSVLSV